VAALWLDVVEGRRWPAKWRSTDLNVYPQFVFHTGDEPSLSPASLAVSVFTLPVPEEPPGARGPFIWHASEHILSSCEEGRVRAKQPGEPQPLTCCNNILFKRILHPLYIELYIHIIIAPVFSLLFF